MVVIIDPQIAGISGDMILCSLVDIGADKNKIISGIKSCESLLVNSNINRIDFEKTKKHGIESTRLILDVTETVDERKGIDIKNAIDKSAEKLNLSQSAKEFATSCIDSLISAESQIHGEPIDSVHFHEASSIDTLVDIIGTAIAFDDLGYFDEKVITMPVNVGSGTISFSHGTVSNPAAAILEIVKNSQITIFGSDVKDELTTPTGACILKNLIDDAATFYPSFKIESIGYGSGTKDFDGFANALKIVKGSDAEFLHDSVKILETNVDDVSGEVLGNLIEKIMMHGAKDVSIYHGITKKGRPTNLVKVICTDDTLDNIADTLFSETGTLGLRISSSQRMTLPRKINSLKLNIDGTEFLVNYKTSEFKGKTSFKIEFDDLKKISNQLNKSLKETEMLIRKEISKLTD